jgi:CubicO group peptidase (beta-lactamase class C family)
MDASASLERIRQFVESRREDLATPGLALAVTDRERYLGGVVDGLANVDAREPVAAHHRFQIGSISKGFTALAVLQQVEEGRIELDAPLTTYLPWFAVRSEFGPITVHHLLSHTSGLVSGTDFTGDAASEVWSLRDTVTGFPPGGRLLYSNVGYKALGLVLGSVTGRPWWEGVRDRVMEPIGMGDADVVITDDARRRLAVGYASPFADRPWLPRHGWAPCPWFESATADGTICATAEQLTAYARLLLAGGAGVVSRASFERMSRPVAEDPKSHDEFGYGLKWIGGSGRRLLGHSGGMVGFTAYLLVDVEAGFGAVALMNSAFGDRLELVRFALACLAAEGSGERLPDVPARPRGGVDGAAAYEGVYSDGKGDVLVSAGPEGLRLRSEGRSAALIPTGAPDGFAVDHPDLDRFGIRFLREDGVVTGADWGDRWLRNERYAGALEFTHPDAWSVCPGRYSSWNPWLPGFRVHLRRGRLWLAFAGEAATDAGGDGALEPLPDGTFRAGEAWSPDRVAFDTVIDGKAQRVMFDAAPYYRTFAS